MKTSGEYDRAKQRALARMKKACNLGFVKPKSRDELYDRETLRKDSESGRDSCSDQRPAADWCV